MSSQVDQQAASCLQSSASLEEVSSQADLNAENIQSLSDLSDEVSSVVATCVQQANFDLEKLQNQFHQLEKAAIDIQEATAASVKVVGAIDEIAFQQIQWPSMRLLRLLARVKLVKVSLL